jgi:hypothetical protein
VASAAITSTIDHTWLGAAGNSNAATLAPPHRQARDLVKPINPLVVGLHTFTPKQRMITPIAKPAALGGKFANACT